jgi:hypothetical protein
MSENAGITSLQVYTPFDVTNRRISQHADQNKMTVQNLANIFGPTLLGSEGSGMEDARAQIRVAETIITYATDMFELGTSLSR